MTKDTKKNIYQRLSAVMSEVKGINKGPKKVNGQYSFVSHDAVAAALHDPFVKHGIMLCTSVEEMNQDGNRTSVKLKCTFVNIDDPKEFVVVWARGYGICSQDKGPGKAISYAFKYCLLKMFCLETGDDVENDNIDHVTADCHDKNNIDEGKVKYLKDFSDKDADFKEWLMKFLKGADIKKVSETPNAFFKQILVHIAENHAKGEEND